MAQSRTLECRETPKRGVKKKRITLDADLALLTDATAHRLIQPVWRCLSSFIILCLAVGRVPQVLISSTHVPKESVCCACALLFLLCCSRYVLFLLWCLLVFIVVVLEI